MKLSERMRRGIANTRPAYREFACYDDENEMCCCALGAVAWGPNLDPQDIGEMAACDPAATGQPTPPDLAIPDDVHRPMQLAWAKAAHDMPLHRVVSFWNDARMSAAIRRGEHCDPRPEIADALEEAGL